MHTMPADISALLLGTPGQFQAAARDGLRIRKEENQIPDCGFQNAARENTCLVRVKPRVSCPALTHSPSHIPSWVITHNCS